MLIVGILAPLLAISCSGLLGLVVVSRMLPSSPLFVRLTGMICLVSWVWVWGFEVLALGGVFRLASILPLFVCVPLSISWWYRHPIRDAVAVGRIELHEELGKLSHGLRQHRLLSAGLVAVAGHVVVRVARTLATPTFGWDDFTYHLFRAARWVQTGGLTLEPAPDAWSYYEFFPWGGDLVWAWSLVWGATDVAVPLAAVAVWIACWLVGYGLARQLSQDPLTSLVVTAAIMTMPTHVTQLSTAYVDNAQLLMFLACSVFLVEAERLRGVPRTSVSFFLGVGCGLGFLIKFSFLAALAVATLMMMWRTLSDRRLAPLVAFVSGTAVALPNLLFNWSLRGSPFYPYRVLESLPYNQALADIAGRFGADDHWSQIPSALAALVVNAAGADPFLNVGWLGLLLLVLGLRGTFRVWAEPTGRVYVLWAVASAAITVSQVMHPDNGSTLTVWAPFLARYLVPTSAGLLVLAGRGDRRLVRDLVAPVLVVEYFLYAPWLWPAPVVTATALVLGAAVATALAWIVVVRLATARFTRWCALMAVLVVAVMAVVEVRERTRYDAYRLFAEGRLDDYHNAPGLDAWPIWHRLDRSVGYRVAVTAGWDGAGVNWLRYGLLGARLQNDVTYVPITTDGAVVDYAAATVGEIADREAWLRRLQHSDIDWVVALAPRAVEHRWIDELPAILPIELSITEGAYVLARVDRQALASHIRVLP